VSGTFGKGEERSVERAIGERERNGARKSKKVVMHGAAFQLAPAPLTCSGPNGNPLQMSCFALHAENQL
jgi:hypothetical protein